MRKICIILLLCAISFASIADGTSVMKIASTSMVYIQADFPHGKINTGSGVIVMDDEVLTNCHVVNGAEKITVQFLDGEKTPAQIKGQVGKLDLCALSAITNKRPKSVIAPVTEVKVGQQIYAVGNPLSLKFTISDGIISAIRDVGAVQTLQITAPISPGSSGGGVFDEKGRLLGLTTFTLTEGQNLNFAIPAEYRNKIGISPIQAVEHAPQKIDTSETIRLICRGDRTEMYNYRNKTVETTAIAVDINVQENWILFQDNWGCFLDYGSDGGFGSSKCRSRLSVSSDPTKNLFIFYQDGSFNHGSSSTSFDLNRTTGVLKVNSVVLYDPGYDKPFSTITNSLNLNCSKEARKF